MSVLLSLPVLKVSLSALGVVEQCHMSLSSLGFPGLPANVLNATVLTASGQPIHLAQGTPQKLIVTQHHTGGQPRLIVPAQQVALLSNGATATQAAGGATIAAVTSGSMTALSSKEAIVTGSLNPGRQILQSLSSAAPLMPDSNGGRVETHKIISGPIAGMSGTPIILQTATLP